MEDLKQRFITFFEKNKGKKFAISTHSRADIDSFVSAYTLSLVFKQSTLCMPDDPNQEVQELMEKWEMKVPLIKELNKKDYDGLIVIDTSAYTLLKEAKEWKVVAVIDHHRKEGRDINAPYEFWDSASPSTAEIVANILPELDKRSAHALALGIISDTARFKSARQSTFTTLANLMKVCRVSYRELLEDAEQELANDLKIAVLKAFQKVEYRIIGIYIVATSEVSTAESQAAMLLSEAADIAFVANWDSKDRETHVSARARNHVKVALNEVMKDMATRFQGKGGGHPKAAGAAVNVKPKEALEMCLEVLSQKL